MLVTNFTTTNLPAPISTDLPSTADCPTTWSNPVIISTIFVILAIIIGIPGAVLAIKKIQRRRSEAISNGK